MIICSDANAVYTVGPDPDMESDDFSITATVPPETTDVSYICLDPDNPSTILFSFGPFQEWDTAYKDGEFIGWRYDYVDATNWYANPGDNEPEPIVPGYPTNNEAEWTPTSAGRYTIGCDADDRAIAGPSADDETVSAPSRTIDVVQLSSIAWSVYHPTNLTPESILGGSQVVGLKIFPDKIAWDDQHPEYRNSIWVKARITPAIANVPVYFRLWDIDDPSSNTTWIDPNGDAGNDNFGTASIDSVALTDSYGYAYACLEVSMRPGDNYRASASLFSDKLASMTLADAINPNLFDNFYIKTIPQYLVVWRKIHVERDMMGEPDRAPAPMEYFGTLNGTVRLEAQVGFYTYVSDIGVDWRPTHSDWLPNNQLPGALFTDTNRPTITNKPIIFNGTTYLALDPGLTEIEYGDPYQINTDDVDPGSSTTLPSTNTLVSAFTEAYVKVVFDLPVGWNNEKIPFHRNLLLDETIRPYETTFAIHNYIIAYPDSPLDNAFWCTYIVAAYESDTSRDRDGEESFTGGVVQRETDKDPPSYAAVNQEDIREIGSQWGQNILAHEVGHTFGLSESGIAGHIMYRAYASKFPVNVEGIRGRVQQRSACP